MMLNGCAPILGIIAGLAVLKSSFRVCGNASLYVPLRGTLACARAHSSVVTWNALSSFPPLRRVSETWLVAGASVHRLTPFTQLQLSHYLHMTCCIALAVAQLPGPMSVLPVHVERETNCQSLTFASHRPCAAVRAHVYGAEETVHGSSVDGVCVPCINYRRYTSKQVQACSLHLPQRPWVACLEKYTADELFCMERTRRASHATPNALVYTALACCTSSIGANVPIQSRCGASPETPGAKSQNGQIAGCGAQLRCTGPLPCQFRQSLPAAWVVTRKTEASVRVSPQSAGMEHPGRSCLTIAP
jgi:hypothetical protein